MGPRMREDEVGKGVDLEFVAFCYSLVRDDEVVVSGESANLLAPHILITDQPVKTLN